MISAPLALTTLVFNGSFFTVYPSLFEVGVPARLTVGSVSSVLVFVGVVLSEEDITSNTVHHNLDN